MWHLITALEEFRHLGVEFISHQENVDTSSSLGKAMFTIIAAIAELERNIIVERIKGGLRKAKAMGKRLGRPSVNLDIGKIAALKNKGLSIRAIAKELNASPSQIHKVLKTLVNNEQKEVA